MLDQMETQEEIDSKAAYDAAREEAIRLFDAQKWAIQDIADTRGFKEIVARFQREIVITESRLDTIQSSDVSDYKSLLERKKQAKAFLTFLDNLLTPTPQE